MRVLTQLSGGLDSVAVLALLAEQASYEQIIPIFFNYGQPYAKQELQAALYATRFFQEKQPLVVTSLLAVDLPLSVTKVGAIKEYIPMRNLALTAVSCNYASALECQMIAVGSKSAEWRPGDPYSFKDSTASFYAAVEDAIHEGTEPMSDEIFIATPVLGWSKARVLEFVLKAGLDLKKLWSCYQAGPVPCGTCYHCEEIAKAFHDPQVQEWLHREMM